MDRGLSGTGTTGEVSGGEAGLRVENSGAAGEDRGVGGGKTYIDAIGRRRQRRSKSGTTGSPPTGSVAAPGEGGQTPRVVVAPEAKPRRPRKAVPLTVDAGKLAGLLMLFDGIMAAAQPHDALRDLWTIPEDEVMLLAEPLAEWFAQLDPELQEKYAAHFVEIRILIALIGVYGLRIAKHNEIIKFIKAQQAAAATPGRTLGFNAQRNGRPAPASENNVAEGPAININDLPHFE